MLEKSIANHRHGIVLSSNTVLAGARINSRPGLGDTCFGDRFNVKSLVEYSQWTKPSGAFSVNEFRFNFRYEYERYLNDWFSLGAFVTANFCYLDNFYPDNDPRSFSEVTYAVGLGLSPKIYHVSDKYYFSLRIDLPLIESGYFQEDGLDPDFDITDVRSSTINQGMGLKFFHKGIRAIAKMGYRF